MGSDSAVREKRPPSHLTDRNVSTDFEQELSHERMLHPFHESLRSSAPLLHESLRSQLHGLVRSCTPRRGIQVLGRSQLEQQIIPFEFLAAKFLEPFP